jgi:hypothetical protein
MLASCEKDQSNPSIDDSVPVQTRTGPGSFSITSGILNFPTVADFHQTVDFISTDTILTNLNSFRSSFSIKTINKQAQIILDSLNNILYYPSKIITGWPSYDKYVNFIIGASLGYP